MSFQMYDGSHTTPADVESSVLNAAIWPPPGHTQRRLRTDRVAVAVAAVSGAFLFGAWSLIIAIDVIWEVSDYYIGETWVKGETVTPPPWISLWW
jgi:hypothetical protein